MCGLLKEHGLVSTSYSKHFVQNAQDNHQSSHRTFDITQDCVVQSWGELRANTCVIHTERVNTQLNTAKIKLQQVKEFFLILRITFFVFCIFGEKYDCRINTSPLFKPVTPSWIGYISKCINIQNSAM